MPKPKGFRKHAGVKVKMKSHSGSTKRFKVSGGRKFIKYNTGHQHNTGLKKTARQLRRLRRPQPVGDVHADRLRRLLPYA
ncbi:MAG TPA: 50S ribosomal protein L35 [Limnochordia bacterium]